MFKKKKMWAPWRSKYITNPDGEGCIFCIKSESKEDEKNFVIYRGEKSFALLNIYPYNNGHTMVAPYMHTGDISELPSEDMYEMQDLVKMVIEKMKKTMKPHGFNVGMNMGRAAGAGFEDHLHIHIVPRWHGDTNFMPVLCNEDVISESLISVYKKLKV
jgi:ATP adenylyltransferase